jgi:hypothetical protein
VLYVPFEPSSGYLGELGQFLSNDGNLGIHGCPHEP